MVSQQVAPVRPRAPHMVLVDVQTTPGMNPQRRKRPTLMAEFTGIDSNGAKVLFRFIDENGQTAAPRLPKEYDISTEYGRQNLKAFKAYKMFYDPSITIIDPQANATAEVATDDELLDAMLRLKQLRQSGDDEGLINLLRRIEGPVGSKTMDMVKVALNRIAKTNPKAILDSESDPKYAQRVLIDKALEAKRIVQRDRFYYYPDNVYGGRLIAEGEDLLLLKMSQDADLGIYIGQSAERLSEYLSAEPLPPIPALTDAQRAAIREFEDAGTPESAVDTGEDGGQSLDELAAMDEEAIRAVVEVAISSNFLEARPGGKVKMPDGQTRTKEQAHAFYVINPRSAEALREELTVQGLL